MIFLSSEAQQDNMRTVFNLTRFEMQYPEFVRVQVPKLAEQTVLAEVKSRMRDFGYSQKIIDSTRIDGLSIDSVGNVEFDVLSDYESESGFDVSEAREKGTIRHFIKPDRAKALAFIIGGFIKGFSKGHWVKGITASNVVEKTAAEMTPIFQERLNEETDAFLQRSLSE